MFFVYFNVNVIGDPIHQPPSCERMKTIALGYTHSWISMPEYILIMKEVRYNYNCNANNSIFIYRVEWSIVWCRSLLNQLMDCHFPRFIVIVIVDRKTHQQTKKNALLFLCTTPWTLHSSWLINTRKANEYEPWKLKLVFYLGKTHVKQTSFRCRITAA